VYVHDVKKELYCFRVTFGKDKLHASYLRLTLLIETDLT